MPQELAKQFGELRESSNSPPDVFAFLEQHNGTDSADILAVLLQDQQHRWKTDQPLKVEEYLARLPNLASDPEIKLQLAVGEFQARQNGDTAPSIDEFTSRFADISDTLRSKLSELVSDGNVKEQRFITTQTYISKTTIGDQQIGRYRLVRILGEGGFGRVYLGFDEELKRQVAIKVPTAKRFQKPEDAEQYLEEARTVASLDHPNIVPVYDTGHTDDGSIYVVSKFIEGRTLRDRIEEDLPNHDENAKLLAAIAQALNHAHEKRLIHRDIKPANILLEDNTGTPYVADFGLAIREEEYLKDSKIAGTPAYMSPEQARGEGHRLDGRSDIFSLGVVFYELLTGKRPFRGSTTNELLHQVVSVDPPHPRELDDSIPAELERICLKALSKRASDRYTTATELADDLRHWKQGPELEHKQLQIVPKGLRSFDADDADFFLDLLPGPRNRDGLPESIQFWKTRIEETDPDKAFSVGLIYGPSGCGKSSLVKAGLLPRLSDDVAVVYVEATPNETETRTLRGLRKQLPELPEDLGLVETLTLLRRGEGRKVVIVLDQFELWLHAHRAEQETELVAALRQCDGGTLQAVVMVRDDFSMAASRFMRELETRIVEGHNFATIDLFDVDHAQKVLTKFGQAFGKLPEQTAALSDEESEFVTTVAWGLAQDGKVVSIRLALFAEMVKGKPWVPATLEEVGGTEGIGVNFLEETFSSRDANPEHRLHQQAAREVLKALLPGVGTDIKGTMQSHEELLEASGYQNRYGDFNDLLRILDGELRLITPTDPEGLQTKSGSDSSSKYYQLTHDYLVPSLHEWLTRKQKETRKGRAELKLEERSALWRAKPENRQLPSLLEWANIRTLTDRKKWTEPQRKMMSRAGNFHGIRSGIIAVILLLLAVAGFAISGRVTKQRNADYAESLVNRLLDADIAQIPAIVKEIGGYRSWADPLLKEKLTAAKDGSREKLRLSLALLPHDENQVGYLQNELLKANPPTLLVIRDALRPHQSEMVESLWKVLETDTQPTLHRFSAACALAAFDRNNKTKWKPVLSFVADQLVETLARSPVDFAVVLKSLEPIQSPLSEPVALIVRDGKRGELQRETALNVVLKYAADDPKQLTEVLAYSEQRQFAKTFDALKMMEGADQHLSAVLRETWTEKTPAGGKERIAKRQANAAVALLKLGQSEIVWPLLKYSADPRTRTYIIHWSAPLGVDPSVLVNRFEMESDVSIRRALLLTLGEFNEKQLPVQQRKLLVKKLLAVYETDPDPGLHGCAAWLLQKWEHSKSIKELTQKLQTDEEQLKKQMKDGQRHWYMTTQGHTMAVLKADVFLMGSPKSEPERDDDESPHLRRIGRTFAIAAHEVTKAQFHRFWRENLFTIKRINTDKYSPTDDSPQVAVDWYDAAAYCNWLSKKEGIPEDQWCYLPNTDDKYAAGMKPARDYLTRTGYRLPTEAEWEFACRAGSVTSRYYGLTTTLLSKYAWYEANSKRRTWPVGRLKPNDFGLFDMQANVAEWCHGRRMSYAVNATGQTVADAPQTEAVQDNQVRVLRGGSFLLEPSYVRSAIRYADQPGSRVVNGFRPARTYP